MLVCRNKHFLSRLSKLSSFTFFCSSWKESKTTYLEDLPPLPEYELASSKLGEEVDDVYLIRAQGLPWSCTIEDVVNFFSGILYICLKYVILSE